MKGPLPDPNDLSEQKIAESIRRRQSKCSAGCGTDGCGTEGGSCSTGGCGVGSLLQMISTSFAYDDARRIIEISYKGFRRDFAVIDEEDLSLRVRDLVIVQSDSGTDWAAVSMVGTLVGAKRKAKRLSNETLPMVVRKANEVDMKKIDQCRISERQAFSVCKSRIEAFHLPMGLVDAEWQLDHRKLTFFFTADGRVDFRELVRDLASIFNTRIELRQIPVRDAAKRIGGMGVCGRELCCTTYLGRYEHVTLDHAKIQQIPANPSKLSGQCGRLKCCLLYEIDTYVEGMKRFPPIESTVRTAKGDGVVQKIDLFKDLVHLFYVATHEWETISLADFKEYAAGRRPSSATVDEVVVTSGGEPARPYNPGQPQATGPHTRSERKGGDTDRSPGSTDGSSRRSKRRRDRRPGNSGGAGHGSGSSSTPGTDG